MRASHLKKRVICRFDEFSDAMPKRDTMLVGSHAPFLFSQIIDFIFFSFSIVVRLDIFIFAYFLSLKSHVIFYFVREIQFRKNLTFCRFLHAFYFPIALCYFIFLYFSPFFLSFFLSFFVVHSFIQWINLYSLSCRYPASSLVSTSSSLCFLLLVSSLL